MKVVPYLTNVNAICETKLGRLIAEARVVACIVTYRVSVRVCVL